MAKYQIGWPLDYRNGGDTVDDMAQKYSKEFNRVYGILNTLRSNTADTGISAEPEPYQLLAVDDKFYIRNAENTAWIFLFDISYRMGTTSNAQAKVITTDDVSIPGIAGKIPMTNSHGKLEVDTVGSAEKLGGKHASEYVLKNMVSVNGERGKIVQTDSSGIAHVSISGSATELGGKAASYYLDKSILPEDTAGIVTQAGKLVKTTQTGVLPVNIAGSPAKIAGISVKVNDLQDGEMLVYRAGQNIFTNEAKGGSRTLTITYEGVPLVQYNGDESRVVDLSICNPFEYDGNGDIGPRLAYPFILDTNGDITISEEYVAAGNA